MSVSAAELALGVVDVELAQLRASVAVLERVRGALLGAVGTEAVPDVAPPSVPAVSKRAVRSVGSVFGEGEVHGPEPDAAEEYVTKNDGTGPGMTRHGIYMKCFWSLKLYGPKGLEELAAAVALNPNVVRAALVDSKRVVFEKGVYRVVGEAGG